MTLEQLKAKYEIKPLVADTANEAIADRLLIVYACDVQGYETKEETEMMAYLWEIRQKVVSKIIEENR